ncbi:MAG: quinolinate synthase NadA [Chthonomonadales bacterium]|nr:quinolinate synthase NadA [Chthonomonadales bacterium]
MFQKPLPLDYTRLDPEQTAERISRAKTVLGSRLVILGHHYQRDEIIRWADYRGDSYRLSQLAAERTDAEYIVFCGVHFMAESADILTGEDQAVILPNLAAGCSMADMASIRQVEEAWCSITGALDATRVVPVTYVNSAASLKAFVGRNGGTCCTSSNARKALEWALEQGERILFFPDQHLGRNTAVAMGFDPEADMALWNPYAPMGGLDAATLRRARILLWKGHCSVHGRFTVEQIDDARQRFPGVRVLVHPECTLDVVRAADENGSTAYIVKAVAASPPGTTWAVGTEINLVSRLQQEHPDKRVFCLDPVVCPCSTMYRIHPHYLLWALESLAAGTVVNRIEVKPEIRRWARVSLERMLSIS